jgi:predicted O-methyltransferase YrrM
MSDEYQYTKDWFYWAPELWTKLIPMLPARKAFLEIGSFEGRSAVWTIENMMEDGGTITCIDTWEGGAEHVSGEMSGAETRFLHNIAIAEKAHIDRHVVALRATSLFALAFLLAKEKLNYYDFIYIDGSHRAKDVITDACMSWPMLKKGGIMVFDDYAWGSPRDVLYRPKVAVDAFTTMFAEESETVHVGYQFIIKKTV